MMGKEELRRHTYVVRGCGRKTHRAGTFALRSEIRWMSADGHVIFGNQWKIRKQIAYGTETGIMD